MVKKQLNLAGDWHICLRKGAEFSPCRKWRYSLWRHWGDVGSRVAFIGLNPSTADEQQDDPTIRRCVGFAKDWGFAGLYMLNLFGFRSKNPNKLYGANDPIGPDNNRIILETCEEVSEIILCWGNPGQFMERGRQMYYLLKNNGFIERMYVLHVTGNGQPGHPLYLKKDVARGRYIL